MANYPTCEPKPIKRVEMTDFDLSRLAELQDMAYYWHQHTWTEGNQTELDALLVKMDAASNYQGYLSRLHLWTDAGHSTKYNHPSMSI